MYNATMQHANASGFYFFDKRFYFDLFDKLQNKIFLARVVKDGLTYCSALFFTCGDFVTYYLSSRNLNHANIPASNLLLTNVAKYANEKGIKWFNLGSGISGMQIDPLFKFKTNFTKNTILFSIGKRIHNSSIYDQLTANFIADKGREEYLKVKNILQFYRGQ